jgi:hypothetical protein
VVSPGLGDAVINAALEPGATGALVCNAGGVGPRERLGLPGIAIGAEKESVSILVAADYEKVVVEAIYRAGELHLPGARIACMTRLDRMAAHILGDIPRRARPRGREMNSPGPIPVPGAKAKLICCRVPRMAVSGACRKNFARSME